MKCKFKIGFLIISILAFVTSLFLFLENRESSNYALLQEMIKESNIDESILNSDETLTLNQSTIADWEYEGLKQKQDDENINKILNEIPSFNDSDELTIKEEYKNMPVLYADDFASFIREKNDIKKSLKQTIEENKASDFITHKMAERLKTLTDKFSFDIKEKEESSRLYNQSLSYKFNNKLSLETNKFKTEPGSDSKIILTYILNAILPFNNNKNLDDNNNLESKYLHCLKRSSVVSSNVNLNVYSLKMGKVDVFETLLYIWEDNPYPGSELKIKNAFLRISTHWRNFLINRKLPGFSFSRNNIIKKINTYFDLSVKEKGALI